jgi:hypothetical protein
MLVSLNGLFKPKKEEKKTYSELFNGVNPFFALNKPILWKSDSKN